MTWDSHSPLCYHLQEQTFLMADLPPGGPIRRVEPAILRTLSPEHPAHLQYIYSMADETDQGYVPLTALAQMLKHCHSHIALSVYDSLKLFELIQEEGKVYETKLALLTSHLVSLFPPPRLAQSFLSNVSSEKDQDMKSVSLDSSSSSQPDPLCNEFSLRDICDKYLSQLKERTQLASQGSTSHQARLLKDCLSLLQGLEDKLVKEDNKLMAVQLRFNTTAYDTDQLQLRIEQLEKERARDQEQQAKLEQENAALFLRIQEFDKKIRQYDKFDQSISLKDQMINNLESITKMVKHENEQLIQSQGSQAESYKQLEQQYNKLLRLYQKNENKGILKQLNKKQLDKYTHLSSVSMLEKQEEIQRMQNQIEELSEINEGQVKALQNCQEYIEQCQQKSSQHLAEIDTKNLLIKKLQEDYELVKNMLQTQPQNNENNLQYLMDQHQDDAHDYQDMYPHSQRNSINYLRKESLESYHNRLSLLHRESLDEPRLSYGPPDDEQLSPTTLHKMMSTKSFRCVQFQQDAKVIIENIDEEIDMAHILQQKQKEFQQSEIEQQEEFERVSLKGRQEQEERIQLIGSQIDKEEEEQEQNKKSTIRLLGYEIEMDEEPQDTHKLRKQIYNSILEEKHSQTQHKRQQSENFLRSMKLDLEDLLDYQKQSVLMRGPSFYDRQGLEQQIQTEQAEYFSKMVKDVKGDLKDIVSVIKNMKHQFMDEHDHQSAQEVYSMINSALPRTITPPLLEKNISIDSNPPGHRHSGELARMSFGLKMDQVKQMVQQDLQEALQKNEEQLLKKEEAKLIDQERQRLEHLERQNKIQKEKLNQLEQEHKMQNGFSFVREIKQIIQEKQSSVSMAAPEEHPSLVPSARPSYLPFRKHYVSDMQIKSIRPSSPINTPPSQDFIGLQQNEYALKELTKKGEYIQNSRIFSDYITRINQRGGSEKRVLLITAKNLFNLNPDKTFCIERRIPLQKIERLQISEQKSTLFAIIVKGEYDYLIESFRRNEILMFLIDTFKRNNWKLFQKEFTSQISIRNRGAPIEKQVFPSLRLHADLHQGLSNACKLGYLEMTNNQSTWLPFFSQKSKDCFFVLTNIGMLGFHRSDDAVPYCLIPVIGCSLRTRLTHDRKAFQIISGLSGQEYLLRAKSVQEKDSWVEEITGVQIQGTQH